MDLKPAGGDNLVCSATLFVAHLRAPSGSIHEVMCCGFINAGHYSYSFEVRSITSRFVIPVCNTGLDLGLFLFRFSHYVEC